jgi:hypothetical protein
MTDKRKFRRPTRDIRSEATDAASRKITRAAADEVSSKTARLRELRLEMESTETSPSVSKTSER